MCPFCYIGKAKFDKALQAFTHKDNVEVEWKSFQLMPELVSGTVGDMQQVLRERKGLTAQQVSGMNAQVQETGRKAGLKLNLTSTLAVNTLHAHRFAHFAKEAGKQQAAEEALFRAYFTDGKNVDDYGVLLELGQQIGLNVAALKVALEEGKFKEAVADDIREAQELGVRGVPFFVLDRKYAVSGAQESAYFLQALEQTYAEWEQHNTSLSMVEKNGPSCDVDGNCEA